MNETITIDGKEYEVLTLDRIGEARHAATATGTIAAIIDVTRDGDPYRGIIVNGHAILEIAWQDLGIQPLKLVERNPVEFVAWTAIVNFHGNDVVAIICPETVHIDTKFQCVAVNK